MANPTQYQGASCAASSTVARSTSATDLRLERRCAESAAPLSNANSATSSVHLSSAELEIAIAGFSHDLRSPLRAIDAYTHLLSEELPSDVSESARSYLERTHRAVVSAQGLIEQFLAFIRCGYETLEVRQVDLSALAQNILDELRTMEPHHPVRVDIAPKLIGWADPSLARRLLQNLLGNAWKFTRDSALPEIRFYADPQCPTSFCVEDTGCGFDATAASRLFRPFARLGTRHDGSGMGLAIAHRIMSLHQGSIRAEGASLKGARFTFTLPIHTAS